MGRKICRLLLIDDDEDDYLLTKDLLADGSHYRYILDWARDYASGDQKLAANRYDAVLVDYDLGGPQTGIDLIQAHASQGYAAPLILYTSRGSYQTDLAAMQAGATMYLTKNDSTPLLLDRIIRYAIERKKIESELHSETRERRQAEAQMQREREILRAVVLEQEKERRRMAEILDSISDGFFAIDRDWRFTYINLSSVAGYDVQPEDLIGRNIWEAFPQLKGTLFEDAYRRAMETGRTVHFEAPGVLTGRWYEVSVYPAENGISIYWLDKSEKRRREQALVESENRYRTILDTIFNGYALLEAVLDPLGTPLDFRFLEANRKLETLTGLKRDEILGHTLLALFPEQAPMWIEMLGRAIAGEENVAFKYFVDNLNKTFDVDVIQPEANLAAVLFIEDSSAQMLAGHDLNPQPDER